MTAATFDVKSKVLEQGRSQLTRRVEITRRIDFSKLGDGTGLAADETMDVFDLPPGYVHERLDPILRTAEGEAATVHVGVDGDADAFAASLNLNGSANAKAAGAAASSVAVAAADADGTYGAEEATLINELKGDLTQLVSDVNAAATGVVANGPGKYFHTATTVRLTCPSGANTINVAVLDLTFVGYMVPTE